MWRWSSKTLITAVISCWLVSTVQAVTYSPDMFNPGDLLFHVGGGSCEGHNIDDTVSGNNILGCQSLTYTHSLSDFNSSTDTLTSATLKLTFYDDNKPFLFFLSDFFTNEEFGLSFEDFHSVEITNGSEVTSPFNASYSVLGSMLNGDLTLTISRNRGDFYFATSTLEATGTRSDPIAAQTPEPGTWVLMGTGLAGLLGYGWRRKQHSTV